MRKGYKWILLVIGMIALVGVIQLGRPIFSKEERQARTKIRQAILAEFPDEAQTLAARYGLEPFSLAGSAGKGGKSTSTVILIHGLDEPGRIWMNLAPILWQEGHAVWMLTYPNDQPIDTSARFFMAQLAASDLPRSVPLSIVAHSMGGLVAREMLTSPELAYDERVKQGALPRVEQLIMVGTPNNGSELARLRGFTEIRDQVANLFKEEYHWLMGIMDGTGEAGLDLLPNSEFLQKLNRRPHPANVRMLVIAGIMRPKTKEEIYALTHRLKQTVPVGTHEAIRKIADGLIDVVEQIGDGLVTVDSARFEGLPLVTVPGTHLTMIRNLTADCQRIPPAIPIIVEQLNSTPPAAIEHQAAP